MDRGKATRGNALALPAAGRLGRRRTLSERLARAFMVLVTWSERHRMRVRLRDLDETALRDLGLTRDMVQREGEKPFWRI